MHLELFKSGLIIDYHCTQPFSIFLCRRFVQYAHFVRTLETQHLYAVAWISNDKQDTVSYVSIEMVVFLYSIGSLSVQSVYNTNRFLPYTTRPLLSGPVGSHRQDSTQGLKQWLAIWSTTGVTGLSPPRLCGQRDSNPKFLACETVTIHISYICPFRLVLRNMTYLEILLFI